MIALGVKATIRQLFTSLQNNRLFTKYATVDQSQQLSLTKYSNILIQQIVAIYEPINLTIQILGSALSIIIIIFYKVAA
jgi:hypothetical protein